MVLYQRRIPSDVNVKKILHFSVFQLWRIFFFFTYISIKTPWCNRLNAEAAMRIQPIQTHDLSLHSMVLFQYSVPWMASPTTVTWVISLSYTTFLIEHLSLPPHFSLSYPIIQQVSFYVLKVSQIYPLLSTSITTIFSLEHNLPSLQTFVLNCSS